MFAPSRRSVIASTFFIGTLSSLPSVIETDGRECSCDQCRFVRCYYVDCLIRRLETSLLCTPLNRISIVVLFTRCRVDSNARLSNGSHKITNTLETGTNWKRYSLLFMPLSTPSHPLLRLLLSLPPHLLILLLSFSLFLLFSTLSSLFLLFLTLYSHRLRSKNPARRRWILSSLGITERPGERPKKVVGFFHPYWFVLLLSLLSLSTDERRG